MERSFVIQAIFQRPDHVSKFCAELVEQFNNENMTIDRLRYRLVDNQDTMLELVDFEKNQDWFSIIFSNGNEQEHTSFILRESKEEWGTPIFLMIEYRTTFFELSAIRTISNFHAQFSCFKDSGIRYFPDNYSPHAHRYYDAQTPLENSLNLPLITTVELFGVNPFSRPYYFSWINIWSNYICNQVDFIPEKHTALFEIAEPLENGAWWLQLTKEPLNAEIPEHRARLRAAYEALPKVGGRDLLIDQVK
jgi:hypothetical protein